ncbi:hypothetical protein L3i20_v233720 [Paenibacillus sp. L3-i20]|nr:hypothetical protein L3i20_v233720 [Paenibacillus sp. L3-i20]
MNDYAYRSVLSSVSNVASISDLTSYEEQNDNLDISLYNLYFSLREDKSKDKVLSRAVELRDTFTVLVTITDGFGNTGSRWSIYYYCYIRLHRKRRISLAF